MSRAYTIKVSDSVSKDIHVEDGIRTKLEILGVLPSGRLTEILKAELEAAGYEPTDKEGVYSRTEDGVLIEIDVESAEVTVVLTDDAKVQESLERTIDTWEEAIEEHREEAKEKMARDLQSKVDSAERKLQEEVTAKLEGVLGDLKPELDRIANRVTSRGLKEKAASMGEIQEITEDEETGSMTIRVKL